MEDARDYIREAQTAEIHGDKAQAIELLKKAADLYQREGKAMRAAQMLRQAQRLGGEEPHNGEPLPVDTAPAKVFHLPDPEPAADGIENFDESSHRKLADRGPSLALPALRAWCSFCCRPSDEAGPVIAGPTGAYICRSCLDESTRLLSVTPRPTVASAPRSKPASRGDRRFNLVGQSDACRTVETAMRSDIQLGMIIGPEGTGKTEFLSHLEASGLGSRLEPSDLAGTFPEGRVFIDAAERLDRGAQDRILRSLFNEPKRQIFLACRGKAPKVRLTLRSSSVELPLYSTSALAKAVYGRLEGQLLERVEAVSVFSALAVAELAQIARVMIAERSKQLSLSDKAILALAKSAATSGRGGHELQALIRRVPAGGWNLEKGNGRKQRD
jgi:hypothetical protein